MLKIFLLLLILMQLTSGSEVERQEPSGSGLGVYETGVMTVLGVDLLLRTATELISELARALQLVTAATWLSIAQAERLLMAPAQEAGAAPQ